MLDDYYFRKVAVTVPAPPVTTYDDEVLADSPVAYWRMDGDMTDTDLGSGGNTLTHTGTPGVVTGPCGVDAKAYTADTMWSTAAHNAAFDFGTGDFTLEWWMACTSWDDSTYLFCHDGNGGTGAWDVRRFAAPSLSSRICGTTAVVIGDEPAAAHDGAWHHWVITYDRDANGSIYMDGATITAGVDSIAAASATACDATVTLWVARRQTAGYARVSMGEVAIYKSLLSPTRIAAHYAARS